MLCQLNIITVPENHEWRCVSSLAWRQKKEKERGEGVTWCLLSCDMELGTSCSMFQLQWLSKATTESFHPSQMWVINVLFRGWCLVTLDKLQSLFHCTSMLRIHCCLSIVLLKSIIIFYFQCSASLMLHRTNITYYCDETWQLINRTQL